MVEPTDVSDASHYGDRAGSVHKGFGTEPPTAGFAFHRFTEESTDFFDHPQYDRDLARFRCAPLRPALFLGFGIVAYGLSAASGEAGANFFVSLTGTAASARQKTPARGRIRQ